MSMIDIGTAGTQSGDTVRDAIAALATGVYSYGVKINQVTGEIQRTGALKGFTVGQSPGNTFLPMQAAQQRCVVNASGEIQYYLDAADSTKKVNGDAANIDGTDGQVVVDRPVFFYRYSTSGDWVQHDIAPGPLPGFVPYPVFNPKGTILDRIFIGAYEGVAYDAGAGAYNDGTGAAASNFNGGAIDTANDKLGSVSGYKPLTDETRAEFRSIAGNVGSGWQLEDKYIRDAIDLLILIEYATFNTQDVIGNGNTSYDAWDYDNDVGDTGYSNADGNRTNASDTAEGGLTITDPNDGSTNTEYMSYRGIENWYGNVWKFIDGLNIHNFDDDGGTSYSRAYVANNPANYADDTDTDYESAGDLVEVAGYQKLLIDTFGLFLPSSIGSSSSTWITDYYYTYFGNLTPAFDDWRVARVGGHAGNGSQSGAFALHATSASAIGNAGIGARLCYRSA